MKSIIPSWFAPKRPPMPIVLSHEPFDRTEVVRFLVPACDRKPCRQCGTLARFRYGVKRDDDNGPVARISTIDACSLPCAKAWY